MVCGKCSCRVARRQADWRRSRLRRRRRRSPTTSRGSASRSSRDGGPRSICGRSNGSATPRRRLRRGFIILIDYGHEARDLYSAIARRRHADDRSRDTRWPVPKRRRTTPPWLERPGEQDLTAHVDFTSVRAAAEDRGPGHARIHGPDLLRAGYPARHGDAGSAAGEPQGSLALKTLLMPGGLGSTHKVLILGKGVGQPALLGCSFRQRVT